MMIRRGAVVLAGLLLTLAGPAAGQKAGVGLQIVPRIGAHLPQSNLTEFRLDSATNIVTRLESSFALGFAVELDLPIPFVNVRANLDYVTGSTSDPFEEQDTSTFALGQTTLLMLGGAAVVRPRLPTSVVAPYLLAGIGLKRHDFDEQVGFLEDVSNLAVDLGLGLDLWLGDLALTLEAHDFLSSFEYESSENDRPVTKTSRQHDFLVMGGFRFTIF